MSKDHKAALELLHAVCINSLIVIEICETAARDGWVFDASTETLLGELRSLMEGTHAAVRSQLKGAELWPEQ